MKEGFKPIKEILIEVAKEEGMSWREIEDIWLHQIRYIKHKMSLKEVYAIFLPYLGTLSLNVKQFKKEIKFKSRSFYKDFIEKVKDLQQHPKYTLYRNAHKKTTGIHKLVNYVVNNFKVKKVEKKDFSIHKKCWDLISKYSNNVLKKL